MAFSYGFHPPTRHIAGWWFIGASVFLLGPDSRSVHCRCWLGLPAPEPPLRCFIHSNPEGFHVLGTSTSTSAQFAISWQRCWISTVRGYFDELSARVPNRRRISWTNKSGVCTLEVHSDSALLLTELCDWCHRYYITIKGLFHYIYIHATNNA